MATTTVLKGDAVVIPSELRERFGLADGSLLVVEADEDEIRLRPLPDAEFDVEIYTPERIAEFLLNNAVTKADYQGAVEEVRRMGLDPDTILHDRPQPWVP